MSDFAFYVGIDDATKSKDVINGNAFGLLLGGIGRYHNGSVLTTGRSICWDVDGEINFLRFVGFDRTSGVVYGNPIGDFGIGRDI